MLLGSPVVRDVTARGMRVRIAEFGAGSPLVLVHGLFANHHAFDDLLDRLAHSFRAIAVDLPGFGESEKPSPNRYPYGPEAYAEVLADVIAALRIGPAHVLGHGIGASSALALAADHAELVDRLVLVAPALCPAHPGWRLRLALTPIVGGLYFRQLLGRRTFRHIFDRELYGSGHTVPLDRIDAYFDAFNAPAAREGALAVLRGLRDTRAGLARLTRVRAPTLLLWGRSDPLASAADAPRIARQLANAHVAYLDSGHIPHEEQPEEVAVLLHRFLLEHGA